MHTAVAETLHTAVASLRGAECRAGAILDGSVALRHGHCPNEAFTMAPTVRGRDSVTGTGALGSYSLASVVADT